MSVNLEELKKEIIDNTATRVAKDLEERLGKKFLTHEEIQEMFKNWKPKKTEESDNLEEVVKFYRGLVKGTNISDEGTSGDLIPRTVSNRILEGLRKASWVRKYVTIFPDTKGTLFVKAQGATAYRTAPGNAPTGSTLQYNIVRSIIEKTKLGEAHGYFDNQEYILPDNLFIKWLNDKYYHVIKMHDIHPKTIEYKNNPNMKICYIYRDIRDVAASAKNIWGSEGERLYSSLDKAINIYYVLKTFPNVIFQKYEEVIFDLSKSIKEIFR